MVNYRKRKVVRRKRTTTARRNRNLKKRYYRKVKKYNKKPKLTVQKMKSFIPDILLTKLKASFAIRNFRLTDVDEAQIFNWTSPSNNTSSSNSNSIVLVLNPRPNQGRWLHTGASFDSSYTPLGQSPIKYESYPSEMMVTNYNSYRPYGCKVKITVMAADTPEVGASGLTGPTNLIGNAIPPPMRLALLPFQTQDSTRGGYWNGTNTTPPLSGDTIPMAKYGKKFDIPMSGGKSNKVFTQYYDCAKIYGMTRNQWMVSDSTKCQVPLTNDVNIRNPVLESLLLINLSEYCTTPGQTRYANVQIDVVNYGRWEGPSIQTYL